MQTVVYACTDLGYDQIFSPVAPTPGVDFLLFADRRPRLVRGWRWRPLPEAVRGMSQTLANRYAKFFPERGAARGTELSVYLDANTLVLGDLTPLVAEFARLGRRHRPLPPPGALDPGGGVRFRPAGRQDPRGRRGGGRGAAPPLPRGRAAAGRRPSPRMRSSSAATAARRSRRRWRSGGRSSRPRSSATS